MNMNSKGNNSKMPLKASRVLEQVLNNLKDCRKFLKPTGTEELEDKLEMCIVGVRALAREEEDKQLQKECDEERKKNNIEVPCVICGNETYITEDSIFCVENIDHVFKLTDFFTKKQIRNHNKYWEQ